MNGAVLLFEISESSRCRGVPGSLRILHFHTRAAFPLTDRAYRPPGLTSAACSSVCREPHGNRTKLWSSTAVMAGCYTTAECWFPCTMPVPCADAALCRDMHTCTCFNPGTGISPLGFVFMPSCEHGAQCSRVRSLQGKKTQNCTVHRVRM